MGLFSFLSGGKKNSELANAIREGAFLVDVRSAAEFSGGSVKGAVNIPVDGLEKQLARFKGKKHIVVFCRSGMRSSAARNILHKNGFTNVINGGTWWKVEQLVNQ